MRTAREVVANAAEGADAGAVVLDYEGRHRRRIVLTSDRGEEVLLDLPSARLLADGDALRLDDGALIAVRAAPERLLRIEGRDARHLLRLAWHIGNRHLPAMIGEDEVLIRDDHVIADMLRGLGARVSDVFAPFSPEGGAYDARSAPAGHGHDHSHDHGHGHHHEHGHAHD
jgi:urease accessory protein